MCIEGISHVGSSRLVRILFFFIFSFFYSCSGWNVNIKWTNLSIFLGRYCICVCCIIHVFVSKSMLQMMKYFAVGGFKGPFLHYAPRILWTCMVMTIDFGRRGTIIKLVITWTIIYFILFYLLKVIFNIHTVKQCEIIKAITQVLKNKSFQQNQLSYRSEELCFFKEFSICSWK